MSNVNHKKRKVPCPKTKTKDDLLRSNDFLLYRFLVVVGEITGKGDKNWKPNMSLESSLEYLTLIGIRNSNQRIQKFMQELKLFKCEKILSLLQKLKSTCKRKTPRYNVVGELFSICNYIINLFIKEEFIKQLQTRYLNHIQATYKDKSQIPMELYNLVNNGLYHNNMKINYWSSNFFRGTNEAAPWQNTLRNTGARFTDIFRMWPIVVAPEDTNVVKIVDDFKYSFFQPSIETMRVQWCTVEYMEYNSGDKHITVTLRPVKVEKYRIAIDQVYTSTEINSNLVITGNLNFKDSQTWPCFTLRCRTKESESFCRQVDWFDFGKNHINIGHLRINIQLLTLATMHEIYNVLTTLISTDLAIFLVRYVIETIAIDHSTSVIDIPIEI
jgi:hypothetical protein